MPKEFSRIRRIDELIQRELSEHIRREIHITGSGMLTVSEVKTSPDIKNATIYISILGNKLSHDEIIADLTKAAGFLRHCLSQSVTIRQVPRLKFLHDTKMEDANNLSALINSAINK
jgi:ribosome-binding factor A